MPPDMRISPFSVYCLLLLVFLQTGGTFARIPNGQAARFYLLEDVSNTLTPAQAWQSFQLGKCQLLQQPALHPGFTRSSFWVMLVTSPTAVSENRLLLINNPHINHIEWYAVTDSLRLLAVTGDVYPFRQRPFIHHYFALPLQDSTNHYLLKIDKRFASLQAHLQLVAKPALAQQAAADSLVNGLLSGIIVLIVLFGLFLFLTTFDKLYIWYALYALCILLWIWTDKGFGFQYLWPDSIIIANRTRPFFLMATMLSAIQFLRLFIQQTKKDKGFYPLKFIQLCMLMVLGMSVAPINYPDYPMVSYWYLKTATALAVVFVVCSVFSLLEKIIQRNRQAAVYLLAIAVMFGFGIAETKSHFGGDVLPPYMAKFGLLTGVVFEMIILTFGLADRFNKYRRERETLLAQQSVQQKVLTDTMVSVQEAERKLLADQLHDEIGSLLSLASLNLEGVEGKQGIAQVNQLKNVSGILEMVAHTVRNISHQLTPVAIEKYGFKNAVANLVAMANSAGSIEVELVIVGFEKEGRYPSNFENTVYRIVQELLQNVLKHASASHVLVQLVEHDTSINLMVEDNGIGVSQNVRDSQLFLRSVQSKVSYLGAEMVMEANAGSGTIINIDIPIGNGAALA